MALQKQLFVSYSRKDVKKVRPVVELMRVSGGKVFRDEDSIPPGKRWRDLLVKAVEAANIVVVFWSQYSSKSEEVSEEFALAVKLGKDIVPVLLDDTPLPPVLAAFQNVDFRGAVAGYSWLATPIHQAQQLMRAVGVEWFDVDFPDRSGSPKVAILSSPEAIVHSEALARELRERNIGCLLLRSGVIALDDGRWLDKKVLVELTTCTDFVTVSRDGTDLPRHEIDTFCVLTRWARPIEFWTEPKAEAANFDHPFAVHFANHDILFQWLETRKHPDFHEWIEYVRSYKSEE
jgi:hypothetical protein